MSSIKAHEADCSPHAHPYSVHGYKSWWLPRRNALTTLARYVCRNRLQVNVLQSYGEKYAALQVC